MQLKCVSFIFNCMIHDIRHIRAFDTSQNISVLDRIYRKVCATHINKVSQYAHVKIGY